MRVKYLTLVILIILGYSGYSQGINLNESNTREEVVDTSNTQVADDNKTGFLDIFKGEPGKAALYSLLIPGGGQVYNKRWWKVPLAIGLDAWLLSNAIFYNNRYKVFDAAYRMMLIDPDYNFRGLTTASQVKVYRDAYRQRKEYGFLYLGIGHLITILDAFVDRHLMDFDIDDDLSVGVFNSTDPFISSSPALSITINLSPQTKKLSDYKLMEF